MSDHGHGHGHEPDVDVLEEMGYETTDINLNRKSVTALSFWFIAFIAFSFGVAWLYFTVYGRVTGFFGPDQKPQEVVRRELPPEVPLLQSNRTAAKDMHDLAADEKTRMSEAGWNEGEVTARIPVSAAIDIVASRGLPTRAGAKIPDDYKDTSNVNFMDGATMPEDGEAHSSEAGGSAGGHDDGHAEGEH